MRPIDSNYGNMYEKFGMVAVEMRALTYTYKRPIITVNQMNRSGYGNTDPDLDNIADSMGIAHTADFIAALYQNEGDREAGIMNMKITKNRLSEVVKKKTRLAINYKNLRITSFDEEESDAVTVANEVIEEMNGGIQSI
jgi:hypothetical protein